MEPAAGQGVDCMPQHATRGAPAAYPATENVAAGVPDCSAGGAGDPHAQALALAAQPVPELDARIVRVVREAIARGLLRVDP